MKNCGTKLKKLTKYSIKLQLTPCGKNVLKVFTRLNLDYVAFFDYFFQLPFNEIVSWMMDSLVEPKWKSSKDLAGKWKSSKDLAGKFKPG